MFRPARVLFMTFHRFKECRSLHTNERQRQEVAEYECKKHYFYTYVFTTD